MRGVVLAGVMVVVMMAGCLDSASTGPVTVDLATETQATLPLRIYSGPFSLGDVAVVYLISETLPGPSLLRAYRASGALAWERSVGDIGYGPVSDGQRLYYHEQGVVRALSPSGAERWRMDCVCTPNTLHAAAGAVVFAAEGELVRLDGATGRVVFRGTVPLPSFDSVAGIASAGGTLWIATYAGSLRHGPSAWLYADDGRVIELDGRPHGLAAVDDVVVVATANLSAYRGGELLWRVPTPAMAGHGPVATHGLVLTLENELVARGADGTVRWRVEATSLPAVGGRIAAVDEEHLVLITPHGATTYQEIGPGAAPAWPPAWVEGKLALAWDDGARLRFVPTA
jgi:hypothetical protein